VEDPELEEIDLAVVSSDCGIGDCGADDLSDGRHCADHRAEIPTSNSESVHRWAATRRTTWTTVDLERLFIPGRLRPSAAAVLSLANRRARRNEKSFLRLRSSLFLSLSFHYLFLIRFPFFRSFVRPPTRLFGFQVERAKKKRPKMVGSTQK